MSDRPPFDPSRIHVPEEERVRGNDGPRPLSPSQVNELVRGALARHVPQALHVLGEIGDLTRPRSGHLYFTLKDARSELRVVMWRSAAKRLKFELEPGMEVIAHGALEVYLPRGSYQLIARSLEPRGVGALEVAFRQLKERLEREGLFDPARKRPLPRIPERVAIVTSSSGAALRDILQTLARRFPALDILLFPVRVQGDGAAAEIAEAIRAANRCAPALGGIDVMVVGRGGGSLEDLWAFNEEVVARAVAGSAIPVVSAVGHEVDVTICDLAADVRAATPTAAAELITPVMDELLAAVAAQAARSERAVGHRLEIARHELDALLATEPLAQPLNRLREQEQRIDEALARLQTGAAELRRALRSRLADAEMRLLRFGAGATLIRLAGRLETGVHRSERAIRAALHRAETNIVSAVRRAQTATPASRLERYDERTCQLRERLALAVQRRMSESRQRLDARLEALAAFDPRAVLRRGYSITREARTRKVIRALDQIRAGTRIITEVADGEFRATADDPRQPDLFDQNEQGPA